MIILLYYETTVKRNLMQCSVNIIADMKFSSTDTDIDIWELKKIR